MFRPISQAFEVHRVSRTRWNSEEIAARTVPGINGNTAGFADTCRPNGSLMIEVTSPDLIGMIEPGDQFINLSLGREEFATLCMALSYAASPPDTRGVLPCWGDVAELAKQLIPAAGMAS